MNATIPTISRFDVYVSNTRYSLVFARYFWWVFAFAPASFVLAVAFGCVIRASGPRKAVLGIVSPRQMRRAYPVTSNPERSVDASGGTTPRAPPRRSCDLGRSEAGARRGPRKEALARAVRHGVAGDLVGAENAGGGSCPQCGEKERFFELLCTPYFFHAHATHLARFQLS